MLEDIQNGASRPQTHTIREVVVNKVNGEYVFPLKEQYEKMRYDIQMPAQSDDAAAMHSDDANAAMQTDDVPDNPEFILEDKSFDPPPVIESDTKVDASITENLITEVQGPTVEQDSDVKTKHSL